MGSFVSQQIFLLETMLFQDLEASSVKSSGQFMVRSRYLRIIILLSGITIGLAILPDAFLNPVTAALRAQPWLLGLLFAFFILAISLLWSTGHSLDSNAFLFINQRGGRPRWLDYFMWGVTQIGNGLTALFLAVIFFLLRFRELALAIVLGMLSLLLVTEVMKSLTERKRPFLHHLEARIVGLKARGLSFPSGHTAQTFFLMSLLVEFFSLSILGGFLLYVLAALVGLTRMYVGAHYPRDVLAGAILGVVWGFLTGMISIGLLP